MTSTRDPEIALSTALREHLDLPPKPNYWTEARLIIRDLAAAGVRVSATEDQRLREIALDTAVRTIPSGYSTGDTVKGAAETYLGFLRGEGEEPAPAPTLPGAPGAPAALHEAVDRAWRSIVEDGERLAIDSDGDEEVLEQLRLLSDDELNRTSFVQAIVRALAQSVRADRRVES